MNGKTKDEYAEASRKVVLIHASSDVAPFTILCKTDRPNQAVTGLVERITCPDCQRILTGQEPVAVPPHVKAIDARRAAEMHKPGNEKLAEWSNAISIVKANLSGIGYTNPKGIKWTVDLSISALEALQAEIVEAMSAPSPEDKSRLLRHQFVGRSDRWCEICNQPDRAEIHKGMMGK